MRSEIFAKQKATNLIHSASLLCAMIILFSILGWVIAGATGLVFLSICALVLFLSSAKVSPALVLRAYRARPLSRYEAPHLLDIIEKLSQKAGLSSPPRVYYVPSRIVNAFSVGRRNDAAIGLTDGILRSLNQRELVGVLAHEISHIRNNDLFVMGLADLVNRTTGMLSFLGQILLFINLPLIFYGDYQIPWLLILLMIFAPTLSSLLQLGLSRQREYHADLEATSLTSDAKGLASALIKLEELQAGFLERIFFPGRRIPDPSLLRTHPRTEERVQRLLQLDEAPKKLQTLQISDTTPASFRQPRL